MGAMGPVAPALTEALKSIGVLKDLKKVYQASKKEEAEDRLLDLEEKWGKK